MFGQRSFDFIGVCWQLYYVVFCHLRIITNQIKCYEGCRAMMMIMKYNLDIWLNVRKLGSVAIVVMILMMGELELCKRITQEETIVSCKVTTDQMLYKQQDNLYLALLLLPSK